MKKTKKPVKQGLKPAARKPTTKPRKLTKSDLSKVARKEFFEIIDRTTVHANEQGDMPRECKDTSKSLEEDVRSLCMDVYNDCFTRHPNCFIHFLSIESMTETALMYPKNYRLLLGGAIDFDNGNAVFYDGALKEIIVPLSFFRETGKTQPDFQNFSIIDDGQTIKFGGYEAASDAVLYEFDEQAREWMDQDCATNPNELSERSLDTDSECFADCGCAEIPVDTVALSNDMNTAASNMLTVDHITYEQIEALDFTEWMWQKGTDGHNIVLVKRGEPPILVICKDREPEKTTGDRSKIEIFFSYIWGKLCGILGE